MWGARCAAAVVVTAGCLCVLAGCTAVKVTRADGSEEYSIHPLGLRWADRQTDGLQYITAQSLGTSRNGRGFDLGYRKEDIVLAPTRCQAVFVINSQEQATAARELSRDVTGNCTIKR